VKRRQTRQRNRFVSRLSLGRIQRLPGDVRPSVKRKCYGRAKEAQMEIKVRRMRKEKKNEVGPAEVTPAISSSWHCDKNESKRNESN